MGGGDGSNDVWSGELTPSSPTLAPSSSTASPTTAPSTAYQRHSHFRYAKATSGDDIAHMTRYLVGNTGLLVLPVTIPSYIFIGDPVTSGMRLYGAAATMLGKKVSYAAWEVVLNIPNLGNSTNAVLGWLANMDDNSVTGVILRNEENKATHIYEADERGDWSLFTVLWNGNKGYVQGVSNKKYMVAVNSFSSSF
jgi:hypothetical protein